MLTVEFSSEAGALGSCAVNWLVARVFLVGEGSSLGWLGEIRDPVNMALWTLLSLLWLLLE